MHMLTDSPSFGGSKRGKEQERYVVGEYKFFFFD